MPVFCQRLSNMMKGKQFLVSPPSTTNAGFGSIWLAARLPALADKGEFRRVMVHWASYGPNTPCATPAMIHALMYIHTQPTTPSATPADPLLWYMHKPQCVDCVLLLCLYRGSYKGIKNALYGACFFSHFDSLFYFYPFELDITLNSKKLFV